MYCRPQLLGRSFQKARNFTAGSHQNVGFSIRVPSQREGATPPTPNTLWPGTGTSAPVLGPKPWSPSTFQQWLCPCTVSKSEFHIEGVRAGMYEIR